MTVEFFVVFSLPKDQDCHELWCKNRKKEMREQQSQEQNTSTKTLLPKLRAYPEAGPGKIVLGAGQREDRGKHTVTSVAGDDSSQGPSMQGDAHDVQSQLSGLINLLQVQENLSVTEIASKLNISVDSQTSMLLNNLRHQLMCTLSKVKQNPASDKFHSVPGATGFSIATFSDSLQFTERNFDPVSTQNSSSNGYYEGSNSSGYHNSDFSSAAAQNVDRHAGVKAALAQLLAQQGIGVKMSGLHFDTSQKTYPLEMTYNSQAISDNQAELSYNKQIDNPNYSSLSSPDSFHSYGAEPVAETDETDGHSHSSQYCSSFRDDGRGSASSYNRDSYNGSASFSSRMGW